MEPASNDSKYDDSNKFFEYWSNLAKTDPERFEKERSEAIEKVILSARPERQKELCQLQWRIDGERARAKNPTDAMVRLTKMMWAQCYAEDGFFSTPALWKKVFKLHDRMMKQLTESPKDAVVLPFKKD